MSIFINTLYIQLLNFIRIKQAVFWSIVFPPFLFVVFSSLFSINDPSYVSFILVGIIGMIITSDGLFSVGSIIKQYYNNGTIRILRKMPINIVVYFSGILVSRLVIVWFSILIIYLCAFLLFSYLPTPSQLYRVFLACLIGIWTFSFIGLCFNFINIKLLSNEKSAINMVYFLLIFTSNAFYPVDMLNSKISTFANYLPLNPIYAIMRSESFSVIIILLWGIIPTILFYTFYKRLTITR